MGHSVQRPSSSSLTGKPRKRLELLPEEALYLMEKGALFCWKASRDDNDAPGGDENEEKDVEWDSSSQGAPMSVQQAYAEMIGREDLTLDRYQVCEQSYLILISSYTFLKSKKKPTRHFRTSRENETIKGFCLPSPTRLHCDSSEASMPRLSHSCHAPTSSAAVVITHHGLVNFPQGLSSALLTCTPTPQLLSPAVKDLVAAPRSSAMAPP
jgi:hypothetical protein